MEDLKNSPRYGQWWYRERPAQSFSGMLKMADDDLPELVIRGKQSALPLMDRQPPPTTLFGRFTTEASMREVSILEAWNRRGPHGTSPPHAERETEVAFFGSHILIGAHVDTVKRRFIDRAIFGLTGLEEWCDTTGFFGKHRYSPPKPRARKDAVTIHSVRVLFRSSASPYFDIGGGQQLRFLSGYDGPGDFEREKQVVLNERNRIEIVFPKRVSIKQAVKEIRIWQTFLSFGLRIPVFLHHIVLLRSERGRRFKRMELIVPERRWEMPERKHFRSDVLFNRSRLGAEIGARLKAWREKQDTINLAVTLFRGAGYLRDVYIHTNVLTYLQALEVFHREFYKIDRFPSRRARNDTIDALREAIPKTLDPALREDISQGLGNIGAPSLLDRLKFLYRQYPKCLKPLFPRGDEDMGLLRHARNYLTHYGDSGGLTKDFMSSREVYALGERARLFLEISFLGVMSMTDDEIFELLKEFGPYRDWCSQTRLGMSTARASRGKYTKRPQP
jgi:ApeA-like protein/HEPN superfamily Apea-like protein